MTKILLILLSFTLLSCGNPKSNSQASSQKKEKIYIGTEENCGVTKQVMTAIIKELKLEESDCKSITKTDLLKITTLNLSNKNLTSLKKGDFTGLTNLKSLHISDNKLETLPKGIFDKVVHLGELDLTNNKLETLPKGIFDKPTQLKKLNLSYNKLKILPEGTFDKLKELNKLSIKDNLFTKEYKKRLEADLEKTQVSLWIRSSFVGLTLKL